MLTDERIIDLENEVARAVGSRRELTIGFARAIIDEVLAAIAQKLDTPSESLINKAYESGWVEAACWAERDDLIADVDSPAYLDDRMANLDSIYAEAQQEPVAWMLSTPKKTRITMMDMANEDGWQPLYTAALKKIGGV